MGRRCEDLAARLWPDNLQEVQDSFSRYTSIATLFTDPAGRPLTACEDLSQFCRRFTRAVALARPCLECGRSIPVERIKTPSIAASNLADFIHRCPLGLTDVTFPIVPAGRVLGYLMSGQVRVVDHPPGVPRPRARQTGDAEECRALISRLPRRSLADIEAIAAGLSTLAWFTATLAASRQRSRRLAEHLCEQRLWIQEHTTTDALTGVANRRHFLASLEAEILRAQRYERNVAVAALDIVGFRQINEGFGHDVGDEVLRSMAYCLTSTVRQTDMVARIDADEFGVLFPETSEPQAMIAIARLQGQVEDLNTSGELPVEIRFAAGIADHGADADSMLSAANDALRQACLAAASP